MTARPNDYTYRKNRAYVLSESTICYLCGKDGATSVDHVVPWTISQDDSIENLRPAHLDCNKSKGKKSLEELARQGSLGPKTSLEW